MKPVSKRLRRRFFERLRATGCINAAARACRLTRGRARTLARSDEGVAARAEAREREERERAELTARTRRLLQTAAAGIEKHRALLRAELAQLDASAIHRHVARIEHYLAAAKRLEKELAMPAASTAKTSEGSGEALPPPPADGSSPKEPEPLRDSP